MNSSHFLTMGVIPELYREYTYAGVRNREEAQWYNDLMKNVLSHKLIESNEEYSRAKKKLLRMRTDVYLLLKRMKHFSVRQRRRM
ncbi:MAG TPA: hypothetical protein DDY31_12285 [Lachnospiraceae bacterium]|nr:hypothetical protein [Lachnospiraceae bacterium]